MKKILPLFLVFILISNYIFFKPKKVEAVGEGAVARVLTASIGERTLAAVAEKAGIKYATKSARELAVKKWNLSLYNRVDAARKAGNLEEADNYMKLADYFKNLDSAVVTPIPEKPGFGKVLVNTAMFLTGADLIYEGGKALYDAGQAGLMTNYLEELSKEVAEGHVMTSYRGVKAFKSGSYIAFGILPNFAKAYAIIDFTKPYWAEIREVVSETIYFNLVYVDQYGAFTKTPLKNTFIPNTVLVNDFNELGLVPTPNYIPEINLQPWVENKPDISTLPESLPVTIPLTETYPEVIGEPWNEPDADLLPEPEEPPEDPTGKKIDWSKLTTAAAGLIKVFPFSIPWDFYDFFSQFNVEPQTPVFGIKTDKTITLGNKSIPIKMDWKIDFSFFDVIAEIGRWGLIIAFDIYMITALRKYTPD